MSGRQLGPFRAASRGHHRWRPRGPGHIVIRDCGWEVVWLRAEPGGGVTITLYTPDWSTSDALGHTEKWMIQQVLVARGSDLPDEVAEKPHRIHWAWDAPEYDEWSIVLAKSRRQVGPSHAGHRRLKDTRKVDKVERCCRQPLPVWRWGLPRPVQLALRRSEAGSPPPLAAPVKRRRRAAW